MRIPSDEGEKKRGAGFHSPIGRLEEEGLSCCHLSGRRSGGCLGGGRGQQHVRRQYKKEKTSEPTTDPILIFTFSPRPKEEWTEGHSRKSSLSPGIRAEAGRGRKIERGEDEIFISKKTGVCLFHVPRTQEAFPHFLLFFLRCSHRSC